jgi:hypothetical protein
MARPPIDPALRAEVAAKALASIDLRRAAATLVTYPPGEPFPRLRGMGFVHDGWTIFMSTIRARRKAREIAANPYVSILFIDTTTRRDHFIQIDAYAVELVGAEFEALQARRLAKEGELLQRAWDAVKAERVGWRFEPLRARVNGYVDSGPWRQAPVVFTREQLGLAPFAVK